MAAGNGDEASLAYLCFDQEAGHVAPSEALQDDFLLHGLVGDHALGRTFDHEEVLLGRMAGGVAHDTLGEGLQLRSAPTRSTGWAAM